MQSSQNAIVPLRATQPAPAHPRMERALAAMSNALDPDGRGYALPAHAAPNDDQRAFLTRRSAEIASWLAPATEAERSAEVLRLLRAMVPRSGDADEVTQVVVSYIADLGDVPASMLREACARFRRGTIGDGRFAPKAGELRREALRLAEPWIAERARIERVLAARVLPPPTESRKADVLAHVRETARQLNAAAAAQGGRAKAEPAVIMGEDGKPLTRTQIAEMKLAELKTDAAPLRMSPALRKSLGLPEGAA